jgi:ring-1,2-phenylacetyl-CoA epoxidase subunit PaaE
VHVLSREPQDIEVLNGRITRAKCAELLRHWVDPEEIHTAFICGPEGMMHDVSQALQEHGLDKSRIKIELFAASIPPKPEGHLLQPVTGGNVCEVSIIQDGAQRSFVLEKNTLSILDAGLRQGLELPYSCKGGVCSTCRAKVLEGEVDMDVNFALEDYEVACGFVLCCQSYPVSDRVVIDFDTGDQ